MTDKQDQTVIELVEGVEGPCIVINAIRVAGPKPWGGGEVVKTWRTEKAHVERAIAHSPKSIAPEPEEEA